MRSSDELIKISLLSQYYFCKRRCSLILLEDAYKDNFYTTSGTLQHSRVHSSKIERRPGIVKIFNMQVFSLNYGLIGRTDCVECIEDKNGPFIDILNGPFNLIPVEYKHGVVRDEREYNIQLCAQAICLEEMYKTKVNKGFIYYIDSNQRVEINLNDSLRQKVLFGIDEILKIISEQIMHEPKLKKACPKCSLYEICNPKHTNIQTYLSDMWRTIE